MSVILQKVLNFLLASIVLVLKIEAGKSRRFQTPYVEETEQPSGIYY